MRQNINECHFGWYITIFSTSFAVAGIGGVQPYHFDLTVWDPGDPDYDYGQTGKVKLTGKGPNQSCPYEYKLNINAKGLDLTLDYWLGFDVYDVSGPYFPNSSGKLSIRQRVCCDVLLYSDIPDSGLNEMGINIATTNNGTTGPQMVLITPINPPGHHIEVFCPEE